MKRLANRGRWLCSRRIAAPRPLMTPRRCGFVSRRSRCAGRGNGERAGSRVCRGANCSWIGSGPNVCCRAGRERAGSRILQVPAAYRRIAPGSEWKLHREWFGNSAMADLLGTDFGLAEAHKPYACHDRLPAHKDALFSHLVGRWRDLFNAGFDVLLYDLTSTYFEIDAAALPEGDKRRHGYSRDRRPDCPQVVIALVVTPEGLPLAYEVLPGNTKDDQTLRQFLAKIEAQYGKARRVRLMDRGIPTEAVPAEMRQSDPPVRSLVGTPKGRLTRLRSCSSTSPGRKRARGCRSNCRPRTASSMSSPKAPTGSSRSGRCAGGS